MGCCKPSKPIVNCENNNLACTVTCCDKIRKYSNTRKVNSSVTLSELIKEYKTVK